MDSKEWQKDVNWLVRSSSSGTTWTNSRGRKEKITFSPQKLFIISPLLCLFSRPFDLRVFLDVWLWSRWHWNVFMCHYKAVEGTSHPNPVCGLDRRYGRLGLLSIICLCVPPFFKKTAEDVSFGFRTDVVFRLLPLCEIKIPSGDERLCSTVSWW